MELVVSQEFLRLKNPLIEIFYSKDPDIDFVLKYKGKTQYIQVIYEIEDYEREVGKLKRKGGIVITWDEEGREGKVKIVPLYKFLRAPAEFM